MAWDESHAVTGCCIIRFHLEENDRLPSEELQEEMVVPSRGWAEVITRDDNAVRLAGVEFLPHQALLFRLACSIKEIGNCQSYFPSLLLSIRMFCLAPINFFRCVGLGGWRQRLPDLLLNLATADGRNDACVAGEMDR